MKKLLAILLVVIITLIYGIVGAIIFIDIQMMQAPETTINLDFIEINTDETILKTMIKVTNPNSFQLITRDFEVVILTDTGQEISQVLIEGGDIPPLENRTFDATMHIGFNGEILDVLTTKITGKLGVNLLGFIKKTFPININVVTSVDEALKDLAPPVIHVNADFSDITEEGINITGSFDVYNPNSFEIYVKNISVDIETETGETVGTLTVTDGVIAAKNSLMFNGTGRILIEALNAKMLMVNMSATAGVKIAGFNKSIVVDTTAQITMPNLEELFPSDKPTDFIIWSDYKLTREGIAIDISLEMINPNKISIVANNITATLIGIKDDHEQIIGSTDIGNGVAPAESSILLHGQLTLPYSNLFMSNGRRNLPDWLLLQVRANVSIQGLEQSLWAGVTGCHDMHPFR